MTAARPARVWITRTQPGAKARAQNTANDLGGLAVTGVAHLHLGRQDGQNGHNLCKLALVDLRGGIGVGPVFFTGGGAGCQRQGRGQQNADFCL